MNELRKKIEEALECLIIDHEPGGGGWIDSESEKEVIDKIESLFSEEKAPEWYNGENIKSSVNYYSPKKDIAEKIEIIQFMGHTGKYEGDPVQMSLYVRLKDGTTKWFKCEQNEDGSFPPNVFETALKDADDYLGEL